MTIKNISILARTFARYEMEEGFTSSPDTIVYEGPIKESGIYFSELEFTKDFRNNNSQLDRTNALYYIWNNTLLRPWHMDALNNLCPRNDTLGLEFVSTNVFTVNVKPERDSDKIYIYVELEIKYS